MKVGIDSYCYHRYFGEVYPDQVDPGVRWTFHDFVNRAAAQLMRLETEDLSGRRLSELWIAGLILPDGTRPGESGRMQTAYRLVLVTSR